MTQQVPVDAVDADQLPRERGLKYDDIARIIGSLYLDSHHRIQVIEEQFQAVVSDLQNKIEQLQIENNLLKDQLRKKDEERFFTKSDNSGPDNS